MDEHDDPNGQNFSAQDAIDQEATDAAKKMVEGTKPPKSDVEIADQIGRITWKLGKRIDESSQQERQPDPSRGTAFSRPLEMPLADGGKVESHLRLGARGVTYTSAEGDEVHEASSLWRNTKGKHTDVSTESKGKGSMWAVDKSKLGAYKPKMEMHISDDPRTFKQGFEPATEEVRSQAISNAAETLGAIRGAVADAENVKRAEQAQPGPQEPQPPVQNAA